MATIPARVLALVCPREDRSVHVDRQLMLIIINLPLIGIWVKFLQIPYRWLYCIIIVFCCIGVYTVNNTTTDVPHGGVRAVRLPAPRSGASRRR